MAECAGKQVDALKNEGAEIVIALTHLGVSTDAAGGIIKD